MDKPTLKFDLRLYNYKSKMFIIRLRTCRKGIAGHAPVIGVVICSYFPSVDLLAAYKFRHFNF